MFFNLLDLPSEFGGALPIPVQQTANSYELCLNVEV
jgi:hypothetical protein